MVSEYIVNTEVNTKLECEFALKTQKVAKRSSRTRVALAVFPPQNASSEGVHGAHGISLSLPMILDIVVMITNIRGNIIRFSLL
jgi:hypothetical protein